MDTFSVLTIGVDGGGTADRVGSRSKIVRLPLMKLRLSAACSDSGSCVSAVVLDTSSAWCCTGGLFGDWTLFNMVRIFLGV